MSEARKRAENGTFLPGNEIGKETRFRENNQSACKYRKEYCDQILAYFQDPDNPFPTFELFAETLGVTHHTLLNWCESSARFSDAYERCRNIQKGLTLAGGMTGKYNPQIVKFMAVNCFGMKEKLDNDNHVTFRFEMLKEIDEESE